MYAAEVARRIGVLLCIMPFGDPSTMRSRYSGRQPRRPGHAKPEPNSAMDYLYIPDIATHLAELTANAPHPTDQIQGRAIYTDDYVKVLAFPFEAGQALQEHTAPHPAVLHFLEGEADVTLGPDAVEAHSGTWIHIPPHLPHSIHARTPVVMLLLIFRTKQ
jgi:quercetin dioxygenase-like cupin family protein